jgi:hypothetical protein
MKRASLFAAAVAILLAASSASSLAQIASTFDFDLEGWTINGDNSAIWQATGGNPGGCLDVNDLVSGDMNWAIAPRKFLGDWSAFTAADTFYFDIYELNTSGGAWVSSHHVVISGPGGSAWANAPDITTPPPTGVWLTGKISFDPAGWTVESGTWEALLASVTSLRVFAEWVNGGEQTLLDNIRLTSSPAAVAVPCYSNTFNTPGTGDWYFKNTGGATNPESGGNGGGYVSIADGTGNSYGYSAPVFHGDWTAYDGNGYLTVDIRIASATGTNAGSPDFIRISGPGGAARVSLTAEDLTLLPRVWTTFAFPIAESSWILDSGTWAGLLANITECRIDLEYFDGSETVGMDNFGLMLNDCPPIDDAIEIHDPDLSNCGYASLVGVFSVALNPMDGELYGVIRASSGGICKVAGPTAGVFIQTYANPAHLIFAPNGDAFVSLDYDGYIYRIAYGGTSSLWVSGFHTGDDDPYGLTIAPPHFDGPNVDPGNILVTDRGYSGPDEMWSFSPSVAEGELLFMPDPGNVDYFDIAADDSETVYACDQLDANRITLLDDQGTRSFLAIDPPIDGMCSIVYDAVAKELYVASSSTETVHRVDPATGATTLVADGFGGFDYCCLEIDAAGRRLYVADKWYNRVYEICLETTTGVDEIVPEVSSLALRAYPNPFNPAVSVVFELARSADVRLDAFDASGRLVRRLFEGRMAAGAQRLAWDGRGTRNEKVSTGVYFLRLTANGIAETKKIVLLR